MSSLIQSNLRHVNIFPFFSSASSRSYPCFLGSSFNICNRSPLLSTPATSSLVSPRFWRSQPRWLLLPSSVSSLLRLFILETADSLAAPRVEAEYCGN